MIITRGSQGTPEWAALRAGKPTASRFKEIITPKDRKLSKAAENYALELVAERIIGAVLDETEGAWMSRGTILEDEARRWYEYHQDVTVERIAFCTTDEGAVGCSPDGLVGEDGLLEIKCPSAKIHVGHLMGRSDPASPTQVQGQLWVTGREFNDTLSFCPGLPPVLVRKRRDPEWMAVFDDVLPKFLLGVEMAERRIRALLVSGRIEGFGESDTDLVAALYGSLKKEGEE